MANIEVRAHYENKGSKPASVTKTDVLTCPVGRGWYVVSSVNICASDGVQGTADIFWYDSHGAVEYQLEKNVLVPGPGAMRLIDMQLVLISGDILRVTPSAANMHVVVRYLSEGPDSQAQASGIRQ